MDIIAPLTLGVAGVVGSAYGWRRIWQSDDTIVWKLMLSAVVAIPWFGLFIYFFIDMPPREVRRDHKQRVKHAPVATESEVIRRWNQQEHIFLAWCGAVFWILAIVAYWLNNWSPGNIHQSLFGVYTDVDTIFLSLLVLAILAWGAAYRAWAFLKREAALRTSNRRIQADAQRIGARG